MNRWLYVASEALASQGDTLALAYESGFIWRSFYNQVGNAIACVREIQPGDEIILGYRRNKEVTLLARFRVGRPDHPIAGAPVFGRIPDFWVEPFQSRGYFADPKLKAFVGIFVEEGEPLSGSIAYDKRNALSRLPPSSDGSARPADRVATYEAPRENP